MRDKVLAKIEQTRQRALLLRKLSKAAEEAERNRDSCLYKLFKDLHDIGVDVRKLGLPSRSQILGEKYAPFGPPGQVPALLLQKIYPELSAKIRNKYAAVLRYVAMAKSPQEKVKEFVRKNGGINGCVRKEKKLRQRAPGRKT
jgi:hypothetical protein